MSQLRDGRTNKILNSPYDRCQYEAIVIGASAGGIKALLNLLSGLPKKFRLPIIIVLHMPDNSESKLAEIFQQHMVMPVHQAQDKEMIYAGHVYFAPPGYHLSIETDRSFSLSCEKPVHYSRPAIDLLMNSAADAYGRNLAGILLTGASFDGAEGLANIQKSGGLSVVQDPEEAEIATMPRAAINVQQPDFILPLKNIHILLLELGESC